MTAVIAPGIPVLGPVPSAADVPPTGPPAGSGPAGTFAALLAAVSAATGAGETTAAAPPGDATGMRALDMAMLRALPAEITAGAQESTGPLAPKTTDETPLLDRPAGVEALPPGTGPGETALEMLMASLLLAHPQPESAVEHALPGGDLVLPVVEPPAEASTSVVMPLPAGLWGTAQPTGVPSVERSTANMVTETAMPPAVAADRRRDEAVVADGGEVGQETLLGAPVAGPAEVEVPPTVEQPVVTPAPSGEEESRHRPWTDAGTSPTWPDLLDRGRPVAAPSRPTRASDGREGAVPVSAAASLPPVTPVAEAVVRTVAAVSAPVEVAEVVRGAVIAGDDHVLLRLDPPELGTLEVHIERQDGAIHVRVEASQSSARELIERSLPALQQALEARDLRVDRLEVRTLADHASGRAPTEQGGQFGRGGQPRQDETPEWSPVAAIEGVRRDGAPAEGRAASGRLDVMA